MKNLLNELIFEKFACISFPEQYDNHILISMNFSSCQLSFDTLDGILRCTNAVLGRRRISLKSNMRGLNPGYLVWKL